MAMVYMIWVRIYLVNGNWHHETLHLLNISFMAIFFRRAFQCSVLV